MSKMTTQIVVRARKPSDDAAILDLARLVFAPYASDPARPVADALRGKRSRKDEAVRVVVAEDADGFLGFAIVALRRLGQNFGPWQNPGLSSLDAIAVRPGAQGRGVGRALLARVEELSRGEHAVVLSLRTAEGNTRARALFEGMGFLSFVPMPRFYAQGQSAVAMMKPL